MNNVRYAMPARKSGAGSGSMAWRALAIFMLLSLVLAACSGGGEEETPSADGSVAPAGESEGEESEGGEPAAEGDDTLVIAVPTLDTENWAPHQGTGGPERAVAYAVYERLIQTDPKTREYVPGIAEEWESNET